MKERRESEWRLLVDRFVASGQTKAAFAKENGLVYSAFYYYIKKHAAEHITPISSENEQLELIEQFYQSELTARKFAKNNGIIEATFYTWLRKHDINGEWSQKSQNRKCYSKSEKIALVRSFFKSELSVKQFARNNDLIEAVFYIWLREYDIDGEWEDRKNKKRKYFSKNEKVALVRNFFKSRLSVKQFSRDNELIEAVFYMWLREYDIDGEWTGRRNESYTGKSKQFKRELLDEYLRSDLGSREFAEFKGIAQSTMNSWFGAVDVGAKLRKKKTLRSHGRSEAEKISLVGKFVASGKTKADFARENGLPYSTLGYYIKKYTVEYITPRFSKNEKIGIVKEFFKSNLSAGEFATENEIPLTTFYGWLKSYDSYDRN